MKNEAHNVPIETKAPLFYNKITYIPIDLAKADRF